MNGSAQQVVDQYLDWVGEQTRMMQGALTPHDLDRLVTTPRYWATFANPVATPATTRAVQQEAEHIARLLHSTSDAVAEVVEAWKPLDGAFTNLVLPDTNFWVNVSDDFGALDWHGLLAAAAGRGKPAMQDEFRIVVPLLVMDELDGLSHRREMRPKVAGVGKYLYGLMGGQPGKTRLVRGESSERGQVTIQLLFDPLGHLRLPSNDDELIDRLVGLRDLLGHPPSHTFFLTHDGGSGFRATNAGLMTVHLPTPSR